MDGLNILHQWLFGGFLLQNFGKVVGPYEYYLLFCECRWGGGSTWEVLGTPQPYVRFRQCPTVVALGVP